MKLQKIFQLCFSVGFVTIGYSQIQNTVYQASTASPGYNNTLIGVGTGSGLVGGGNNTIVGINAGLNLQSEGNTFVGSRAGNLNVGGKHNVYMGFESGLENPSGNRNIFLGYRAGAKTSGGEDNIALGWASGSKYTGIDNSSNIALGRQSAASALGSHNVTFGLSAGEFMIGSSNFLMGWNSGKNLSGNSNIMLGLNSGTNITTGDYNIFLGQSSGWSITSGNSNLFVGVSAGSELGSGEKNTIIGPGSGRGLINGSSNTFLGYVRIPDNSTLSSTIILADGNNNQRLYINSDGNVGIGTTAPLAKLDVNGAPRFRGLTNGNNTYFLSVDNDGYVKRQLAGAAAINIYNSDGKLETDRTVAMDNKRLVFNTSASGRIYIGNTNTASPGYPANYTSVFTTLDPGNNYRLFVEGGVLTEKVKVALRSGADWKDSVFASDYSLMPLNEVESFLKENKHLPGIESANELVKSGLDLGDMQAKQMGKIEELTLYVIEQNKTLEKQNKEIEELKAIVKVLMEKK